MEEDISKGKPFECQMVVRIDRNYEAPVKSRCFGGTVLL